MSPTALDALCSLVLCGVASRSVRCFSPRGSLAVMALCVRSGAPFHAEGDDVAQALERLARKVGYVAGLERAERRLQAVAL